jgi:threonine synthase
VVPATAHPAKFNEAVIEALGREAPPPPALQGLMTRATRCTELDATAAAVRGFIERTVDADPDG